MLKSGKKKGASPTKRGKRSHETEGTGACSSNCLVPEPTGGFPETATLLLKDREMGENLSGGGKIMWVLGQSASIELKQKKKESRATLVVGRIKNDRLGGRVSR